MSLRARFFRRLKMQHHRGCALTPLHPRSATTFPQSRPHTNTSKAPTTCATRTLPDSLNGGQMHTKKRSHGGDADTNGCAQSARKGPQSKPYAGPSANMRQQPQQHTPPGSITPAEASKHDTRAAQAAKRSRAQTPGPRRATRFMAYVFFAFPNPQKSLARLGGHLWFPEISRPA